MKMMMILSGGVDSTTALYELKSLYEVVECLTFDYGQRHRREIDSARLICETLSIPHRIIDISNLKIALNTLFLINEIKVINFSKILKTLSNNQVREKAIIIYYIRY